MSLLRRRKKATSKPSPSPSPSSNVTVTSDAAAGGLLTTRSSTQPTNELYDLIGAEKFDEASRRCQSHPQDARWENGGWLPIHRACRHGTPLSLIRQLHHAYPEGVRTRDYHGRLPLYIACSCSSTLEVVEYLHLLHGLDADGVIAKKDSWEETPIDKLRKTTKCPKRTKLRRGPYSPIHCWVLDTAASDEAHRRRTSKDDDVIEQHHDKGDDVGRQPPIFRFFQVVDDVDLAVEVFIAARRSSGVVVDDTFNIGGEDATSDASGVDEVRRALDAVNAAVAACSIEGQGRRGVTWGRRLPASAAMMLRGVPHTVVEETAGLAEDDDEEARATVKEIETALLAARKVLEAAAEVRARVHQDRCRRRDGGTSSDLDLWRRRRVRTSGGRMELWKTP